MRRRSVTKEHSDGDTATVAEEVGCCWSARDHSCVTNVGSEIRDVTAPANNNNTMDTSMAAISF